MNKSQKIDKQTFKDIFRDHFGDFVMRYPRYQAEHIRDVVERMLGCAEEESGYATYKCMDCQEERVVPFSCKSSFCLSCARIRLENWLQQMEWTLFEEVDYRHVVLTMPEVLRVYFYREPEKLKRFIQVGLEMLKELIREVSKKDIECGYIVVLQTAGRSGKYNPHLHIMMTAGGLDDKDEWHDINYIPFNLLHKKWQYHLFEMMKEEFGEEIKPLIDRLYRKYPRGIVAHIKMEKVPKKEQLARYLMKYVGSPPIALSRIIDYDGKRVKYWYKDHRTGKREFANVDVLTFIGRMVQHILPKGFQTVRYYGLQATCKVKKVKDKLREIFKGVGRIVAGVFKKKTYRERIREMTGKDPFICLHCGSEMVLWEIWIPGYGIVYSEMEELKNGKYGVIEEEKTGDTERRTVWGTDGVLQLSLF